MNKIEMWPIEKVKPYPKNAKKHKVKWIAKSIKEFDFDQPIVVDKKGIVIKGHGRLEAAKQLELTEVPVIVRKDLNKKQAAMARLADNRAAQGGGFDIEILGEELETLKLDYDENFFNDVGFTDGFLKNLSKEDMFGFSFDDGEKEEQQEEYVNYETDKYPLAIVLNTEQNDKWQQYKQDNKKVTDTAAFLLLIENL